VKMCSCTLLQRVPESCDVCPIGYKYKEIGTFFLPIDPDKYDIIFGDDYVLLRKKK